MRPTAFNGLTLNGTDYGMVLNPVGTEAPLQMELALRPRSGMFPVVDDRVFVARRVPFLIWLKPGSAVSVATFKTTISQYFTPYATASRTLTGLAVDGVTTVQAAVEITTLTEVTANLFKGELVIVDGSLTAASPSTDSSSPLTVTGNFPAQPVITLTPNTTTVRRTRVTVTDNTGTGLANYPVMVTFDSSGYGATANSNYAVFYNGRLVPFFINGYNSAASKLFVCVDVPPNGASTFDIYFGSSVSNTITADTLDKAGMALTSATFSNTQWEWDAPFTISTNPRGRAGAWVAGKFGGSVATITTESGITWAATYAAGNSTEPDGFSAIIPAGAGTTNALKNLSRGSGGSFAGAVLVKKRVAGQYSFTTIESTTARPTSTSDLDVDNAVQLLIYADGSGDTVTWALAGGANLTLVLDSTKTPTVTAAASVAARYLNGTLTNTTTGDYVIFDKVYMDDVTLTIDTAAKTIQAAASTNPVNTAGNGITFSNKDRWLPLAVGSNSWTNPTGAAAAFAWLERYLSA